MTDHIEDGNTTLMKIQEWKNKCADRYVAVSAINRGRAEDFADACADLQYSMYGDAVAEWEKPDEAADADMNYWEDDGEE